MKNILLLETISEEADRLLRANARVLDAPSPFAGGEIAAKEPVHAIITRGKGDVNEALIRQCPDLEVIARCGVGLDNVNVDVAARQGVKVVFAPGSNADTVAEHTLALMLCLQRNLYHTFYAVKNRKWDFRNTYAGDEIRGKTLGILGMGNIGKKVARLGEAFGMNVVYSSASNQEVPYPILSFDELLRRSDIISLHLPLTTETRHLIDRNAFEKMKPNALLINTARGAVIDQAALTEALKNNRIGGFGADVLTTEPPSEDDPLPGLPNVLITPHSASLTARTYHEMCEVTVKNTLALLAGKPVDDRFIFK